MLVQPGRDFIASADLLSAFQKSQWDGLRIFHREGLEPDMLMADHGLGLNRRIALSPVRWLPRA